MSLPKLAGSLVIALILSACSGGASPDSAATSGEDLSASASSFVEIGEFVAVDGKEDSLKAALLGLQAAAEGSYDVQYTNVHQNVADPHQFLAIGVWRTAAAFDAYSQTPDAVSFDAAANALLASPAHLATFSVVRSLDLAKMRAAASNPDSIYTVATAQTATEADRVKFLDLQSGIIAISRKQAGNTSYDFFRSDEPGVVESYEVWATPAAEQAHLASPPLTTFVSEVGPLLAGPPQFRHFKNVPPLY